MCNCIYIEMLLFVKAVYYTDYSVKTNYVTEYITTLLHSKMFDFLIYLS